MNIPKGGRGVKAPYETVVMRIPKPIEEDVLILIQDFRNGTSKPVTSKLDKEQLLDIATVILKKKKSAKLSIEMLLKTLLDDSEINL